MNRLVRQAKREQVHQLGKQHAKSQKHGVAGIVKATAGNEVLLQDMNYEGEHSRRLSSQTWKPL